MGESLERFLMPRSIAGKCWSFPGMRRVAAWHSFKVLIEESDKHELAQEPLVPPKQSILHDRKCACRFRESCTSRSRIVFSLSDLLLNKGLQIKYVVGQLCLVFGIWARVHKYPSSRVFAML